MSALKNEFHEFLAGEYGALESLEAAYRAAYQSHESLRESLPVYRNREQAEQLHKAYMTLNWAKWRLDTARGWAKYARFA